MSDRNQGSDSYEEYRAEIVEGMKTRGDDLLDLVVMDHIKIHRLQDAVAEAKSKLDFVLRLIPRIAQAMGVPEEQFMSICDEALSAEVAEVITAEMAKNGELDLSKLDVLQELPEEQREAVTEKLEALMAKIRGDVPAEELH